MTKVDIHTELMSARCADCGAILINPGYHKVTTYHCGKLRRWYDIVKATITTEDGRDRKGRFTGHPTVSRITYKTIDKGGN